MANPTYSLQAFGIDAAMLYRGTNQMGQTRGGCTVDPGPIYRDPEFDGVPQFVEDQSRITGWNTRVTARFGVFTPDFWMLLNPSGTSDGSTGNNAITPPDARVFIADTMADIRVVWRISNNLFHAFVGRRARFAPWSIAGEDNNEVLIDATLQFLCDPADLVQPPYRIMAPYDHDTYTYTDYFSA